MIVDLVAAAVVAAALVLALWLVLRVTGRRLPRGTVPLAVGLALVGYAIYAEYSWSERVRARLPPGAVVVHAGQGPAPFSPWAKLFPRDDRLSVVDAASVRRHPDHPDLVIAELALIGRYRPTRRVTELVDCAGGRRTTLGADQRFDETGLPLDPEWRPLGRTHPLSAALCDGAARQAEVRG